MTQAIHERMLDREDALLPTRCRQRKPPRLIDQWMIETAEVDLDRRHIDLEILA